MKKSLRILICVFLILMTAACRKPDEPVAEQQPENQTSEPEEEMTEDPEEEQLPVPEDNLPDEEEPAAPGQNKVMLDVPQSVQENGYYCGPAILQMILSWHGISSDQSDLAGKLNTSSVTGTEYADMARVLNTCLFDCEMPAAHAPGYRVQELTPKAVSDEDMRLLAERVITDIGTGDPVSVAVDLSVLYPGLSSANHFVLIIGYKTAEDGETITDYYVRDPYYKVQDETWQGLKVFTVSEMCEALSRNSEPAYIW